MTHDTQSTPSYPSVTSDTDFVALERDILRFWDEQSVFETSVGTRPALNKDGSSNAYVFYDGPPFANGLPHHGHLLTGYVKDMVGRYQTMRGKRVERRFGWDCHGLPAEMETEKQLGVSGRQEIINYGVDKFNDHCRTSVMRYRDDWEEYVNRQARWVDFDNDYKTMDTPYMESVLWAFSELHKKGLIYEGFKVMPYSWSAETVLSSSEIRLDDATREKVDKACYVAFKLKNPDILGLHTSKEIYVIAWTTTPWTLPSNLALAASSEIEYFAHHEDNKYFIGTTEALNKIYGEYYAVEKTKTAQATPSLIMSSLIGLEYEPLFPHFADHDNAFHILDGTDFIEAGSGTGIVHMAPGFGEDDQRVCADNGVQVVVPVDDEGRYTDALYDITRIDTDRLYARPFSAAEYEMYKRTETDKAISSRMATPKEDNVVIRAEFERIQRDQSRYGYTQWAVFRKEDNAFIGRAGFDHRDFGQPKTNNPERIELRYALFEPFWNNGYVSEISKALLEWAAHHTDATEADAGTSAENDASLAVLKKLGFIQQTSHMFNDREIQYFTVPLSQYRNVASADKILLSSQALQLKGLNVIQETEGKTDGEPYSDAQLTKYGLANLRIIQWLKATGQLVKQEDYAHNYPHCWRTDKPIIYRAMSSWFVDVPKIRDRMVELNQEINWIPGHIKDGRFGKWLENAREWSISRSRFWGCPLPVWRSDNPDNDALYVFGSVAELEAFFNVDVPDLHKPFIDTLTKPDPHDDRYTLSRIDEVFDCWFESGSMPYAQVHYPFENKEWFEANYPADFIVEYEAQTRGWFYNMTVLSVALFDNIPFKNCICHGVVLDDQGRKLSKRLKNYMDPKLLFDTYGSDALRWFMLSSTIMRGNELFLDPEGAFIRDAVRLYIKPLWNAYHFFSLYANADGITAALDDSSTNMMDRYILAKLSACASNVRDALDAYDTPRACQDISAFLEVLNNWYIRRNRARFWSDTLNEDKRGAYNTLYTVLHSMCRIAAPFLPQITEHIFAGLVNGGKYDAQLSVHVAYYPDELLNYKVNQGVMQTMDRVRDVCNVAHAIRNDVNIRIRQPLASLTVYNACMDNDADYYSSLIADETNVKDVILSNSMDGVAERVLKINFKRVGKRLGPKMKQITMSAKAGEWQAHDDGTVTICGETLQPDECEFALHSTIDTGAAALSAQDGLVVLDTTLTDALIQEGVARDIVRLVQQSRKDAGFNVADRITLCIDAPPVIADAVNAYQHYICEQTLTDAFISEPPSTATQFTYDLSGSAVTLSITRVSDDAPHVASA